MTNADHRTLQTELDYKVQNPKILPVKGVWDSKDKRQFRRHPLAAETILIANGKRFPCVIEDIAIGGLRVKVDAALPIHTLVKFEDELAGILKGKVLRNNSGTTVIKINNNKCSAAYMLDLMCSQKKA
jgi:hypothetical protein